MQRLEVSCAVRHIYVVRRQRVKSLMNFFYFSAKTEHQVLFYILLVSIQFLLQTDIGSRINN